MIPRGALVEVFGEPGVGKTFVALDIGLSVAGGKSSWHGRSIVANGPVVLVAPEGRIGLQTRIDAWIEANPVTESNLNGNFFLCDVPLDLDQPGADCSFLPFFIGNSNPKRTLRTSA